MSPSALNQQHYIPVSSESLAFQRFLHTNVQAQSVPSSPATIGNPRSHQKFQIPSGPATPPPVMRSGSAPDPDRRTDPARSLNKSTLSSSSYASSATYLRSPGPNSDPFAFSYSMESPPELLPRNNTSVSSPGTDESKSEGWWDLSELWDQNEHGVSPKRPLSASAIPDHIQSPLARLNSTTAQHGDSPGALSTTSGGSSTTLRSSYSTSLPRAFYGSPERTASPQVRRPRSFSQEANGSSYEDHSTVVPPLPELPTQHLRSALKKPNPTPASVQPQLETEAINIQQFLSTMEADVRKGSSAPALYQATRSAENLNQSTDQMDTPSRTQRRDPVPPVQPLASRTQQASSKTDINLSRSRSYDVLPSAFPPLSKAGSTSNLPELAAHNRATNQPLRSALKRPRPPPKLKPRSARAVGDDEESSGESDDDRKTLKEFLLESEWYLEQRERIEDHISGSTSSTSSSGTSESDVYGRRRLGYSPRSRKGGKKVTFAAVIEDIDGERTTTIGLGALKLVSRIVGVRGLRRKRRGRKDYDRAVLSENPMYTEYVPTRGNYYSPTNSDEHLSMNDIRRGDGVVVPDALSLRDALTLINERDDGGAGLWRAIRQAVVEEDPVERERFEVPMKAAEGKITEIEDEKKGVEAARNGFTVPPMDTVTDDVQLLKNAAREKIVESLEISKQVAMDRTVKTVEVSKAQLPERVRAGLEIAKEAAAAAAAAAAGTKSEKAVEEIIDNGEVDDGDVEEDDDDFDAEEALDVLSRHLVLHRHQHPTADGLDPRSELVLTRSDGSIVPLHRRVSIRSPRGHRHHIDVCTLCEQPLQLPQVSTRLLTSRPSRDLLSPRDLVSPTGTNYSISSFTTDGDAVLPSRKQRHKRSDTPASVAPSVDESISMWSSRRGSDDSSVLVILSSSHKYRPSADPLARQVTKNGSVEKMRARQLEARSMSPSRGEEYGVAELDAMGSRLFGMSKEGGSRNRDRVGIPWDDQDAFGVRVGDLRGGSVGGSRNKSNLH
ncbi:hypothetical protein BJ742DRAFT_841077 [Cladochytrium replicatum]|nr:hypothetical protein BJ742DRAFT_841077 [Cladochytrium replicatum]